MMENRIEIDRKSRIPLRLQIKNQIQDMIYKNLLLEGKRLPPTRKLAQMLGVNRSTVMLAYDELLAEDLVNARVGRGTVVRKRDLIRDNYGMQRPLNWSEYFSSSSGMIWDLQVKYILEQCAQEDIISFAVGVPDPESFPIDEFEMIVKKLLQDACKEILQSPPIEGYFPLREILADRMVRAGHLLSPEEVMIVSGAIQGLYLLTKALLNRGDLVFVESPTFVGALELFRASGAHIIEIPIDEEGMKIDVLENLLSRKNPKFIYTLPTFQNPSGVVLSLERRKKMLDLAYKYQVPIIEDDPYSMLYYGELPPPSLKSLDQHNHVIYIGTFSKILFPGLRIGWVAAAKDVIKRLCREKQFMDLHSNSLAQFALYEFCKSDLLEDHLKKVRSLYARKRDLMITALKKFCSPFLIWNKPQGGYNLWCSLTGGLYSRELLRELHAERVVFLIGEIFFHEGKGQELFRLNFTFPSETHIEEGVKGIRKALLRLKRRSKSGVKREKIFTQPIV